MGRPRPPLSVRQEAAPTSDIGSTEGSECASVEFTKEEVEALLNEKLKVKKFDHKVYFLPNCWLVYFNRFLLILNYELFFL